MIVLILDLVVAAGLLDGLNPCAFATIIFLLSYLQVARKSGREILQIGVAYILGVFCTYFALGRADSLHASEWSWSCHWVFSAL
ncbi:MAG: hypothetical protein ACFCU3_01325 [Verrucomicrobiales bacterium]